MVVELDLEAFVAGLIHAVNNPLTYVQTNLTSLRRDVAELAALVEAAEALLPHVGPERAAEVERFRRLRAELAMEAPREVLAGVVSDAQDGLRQVQAYLRATRTLPRSLAGEPETFDLVRFADEAAAAFRGGLTARLVFLCGSPPAGQVTGVRAHWLQILLALLQNAREALATRREAREPGRIEVTWGPGHVMVDDDGPGVPVALHDRVFLPFFTTRPGSVGLGLATARQMARMGGGEVELAPGASPLGGARFIARWPRV